MQQRVTRGRSPDLHRITRVLPMQIRELASALMAPFTGLVTETVSRGMNTFSGPEIMDHTVGWLDIAPPIMPQSGTPTPDRRGE
jgi:hypothetical protein